MLDKTWHWLCLQSLKVQNFLKNEGKTHACLENAIYPNGQMYTQQNKIRVIQFISHTYYIKIVRCTFKKNLWCWENFLFQNIVYRSIDNILRAFATVSRKKVLTYRICLNFQYSFIGINLKRKCEKNDRSPSLFFQKIFAKYTSFSLKSGYFFESMKS